jgi:hypothetical protein
MNIGERLPQCPANENEAYAWLLCHHLNGISYRLRRMTPEHADWTPDPAAPTARIVAVHAWQWLICDRHHIAEPDATRHPVVPEPPEDLTELCDAIDAENERWLDLLLSLTAERLAEKRHQFNREGHLSVRWFVCHMIQNAIYKHGQLASQYFALGYDGTEPYTAPFPNAIYDQLGLRTATTTGAAPSIPAP